MRSLRVSLMVCVAAIAAALCASEAQAADNVQGSYTVSTPSGNVTVVYSKTGSQGTIQNFKVSRSGQADRYYRGLTNNPVVDLYTTYDADHGGTFAFALNSTPIYSPQVTVPNLTFYLADATPTTYQNAYLQAAKAMLIQDRPVLDALRRSRVSNAFYVVGAFPAGTNDYTRSDNTGYSVTAWPAGSTTLGGLTLGGCLWGCAWFYYDCSLSEASCVSSCEYEFDQIAVDWRNQCGVSLNEPIGHTLPPEN